MEGSQNPDCPSNRNQQTGISHKFSAILDNSVQNLLPHHGEMRLFEQFYDLKEADSLMENLRHTINWRQEPIWMFGKQVMQPRLTALYGDSGKPYAYSGIQMEPTGWKSPLIAIRKAVEEHLEATFTHVLLNLYRDGQDSMGWHRDNEASLGPCPLIASLSFGATRRFHVRNYQDKKEKQSILLTHGSLLVMAGQSQVYWEHQVPKSSKVREARINLTFRRLI